MGGGVAPAGQHLDQQGRNLLLEGEVFRYPERSIVPLPVQKPHPPLWLACSNEETHKIAGRMGLGLLTLVVMVGPEEVARRINLYRDALKEVEPVGSFVNNRTAVFYMVHCADTDKEARENAERGFMSYVNTIFTVSGQLQAAVKEGTRDVPLRAGANLPPGVSAQEVNMDYLLRNRTVICGSPRHLHRANRAHSESHGAGSHDVHAAVLVDTARKGDEIDPVVRKTRHPAFRQTKWRGSGRRIPLNDSSEQRL